jgi:hypothetical protein
MDNKNNPGQKAKNPQNEPKSRKNDPQIPIAVSEYINKFNSSDSHPIKALIDYLENTNKNLQRCVYKPENTKDLLKDDLLVNLVLKNPDNIKNLISLFQKRISELKVKANSDFGQNPEATTQKNQNQQKSTPLIKDTAKINYFFFENLNDEENINHVNKLNFIYLIILTPADKHIHLVTFDKEIPFSFQNSNSLLNDKPELLEILFGTNYDKFIEEQNCTHFVNLKKFNESISTVSNTILNINNKIIQIENYTLTKSLIPEDNVDALKDIFVKKEIFTNFISTNGMKQMRTLLEKELKFFSANNQLTNASLIINQ